MILLEAGSDTTAGFLQSLVLMLAAHSEVMLRAQKEIDGVVGDSRLPGINDIDQCPYITAIIKEVDIFFLWLWPNIIMIPFKGYPLQANVAHRTSTCDDPG